MRLRGSRLVLEGRLEDSWLEGEDEDEADCDFELVEGLFPIVSE